MDSPKLREVIALYRKALSDAGAKSVRYPIEKSLPLFFRRSHAINHCFQMLDQMETFLDEGRLEKTFRWLGFVQGALWALRLNAVSELKDHNKPTV